MTIEAKAFVWLYVNILGPDINTLYIATRDDLHNELVTGNYVLRIDDYKYVFPQTTLNDNLFAGMYQDLQTNTPGDDLDSERLLMYNNTDFGTYASAMKTQTDTTIDSVTLANGFSSNAIIINLITTYENVYDSAVFMLEIAKRQVINEMSINSPASQIITAPNIGDFSLYSSGFFTDKYGEDEVFKYNVKVISSRINE